MAGAYLRVRYSFEHTVQRQTLRRIFSLCGVAVCVLANLAASAYVHLSLQAVGSQSV